MITNVALESKSDYKIRQCCDYDFYFDFPKLFHSGKEIVVWSLLKWPDGHRGSRQEAVQMSPAWAGDICLIFWIVAACHLFQIKLWVLFGSF